MSRSTALVAEPFDPARELALFVAGLAGEGGVASFVGLARPRTRDGAAVERLFLDHHPRLTAASLDEIAGAAGERFGVGAIRVVHRCGAVLPGEAIVFVAAAAAHRRAAFDAVDHMMDRLKTEAVFWKREDLADETRWIEPTEADRAARGRWDAA